MDSDTASRHFILSGYYFRCNAAPDTRDTGTRQRCGALWVFRGFCPNPFRIVHLRCQVDCTLMRSARRGWNVRRPDTVDLARHGIRHSNARSDAHARSARMSAPFPFSGDAGRAHTAAGILCPGIRAAAVESSARGAGAVNTAAVARCAARTAESTSVATVSACRG